MLVLKRYVIQLRTTNVTPDLALLKPKASRRRQGTWLPRLPRPLSKGLIPYSQNRFITMCQQTNDVGNLVRIPGKPVASNFELLRLDENFCFK